MNTNKPKNAGTKTVMLARHEQSIRIPGGDLWQAGADLHPTERGGVTRLVRHIRSQEIEVTIFFHSLLPRSIQTVSLLTEMLGPKRGTLVRLEQALGPNEINLWNQNWKNLLADEPALATRTDITWTTKFNDAWPELCAREGAWAYQAVRDISRQISVGKTALAIGHDPLINLAHAEVTKVASGPDMGYCQYIEFIFDENNVLVDSARHYI